MFSVGVGGGGGHEAERGKGALAQGSPRRPLEKAESEQRPAERATQLWAGGGVCPEGEASLQRP